jgi:hypothetical protein
VGFTVTGLLERAGDAFGGQGGRCPDPDQAHRVWRDPCGRDAGQGRRRGRAGLLGRDVDAAGRHLGDPGATGPCDDGCDRLRPRRASVEHLCRFGDRGERSLDAVPLLGGRRRWSANGVRSTLFRRTARRWSPVWRLPLGRARHFCSIRRRRGGFLRRSILAGRRSCRGLRTPESLPCGSDVDGSSRQHPTCLTSRPAPALDNQRAAPKVAD